MTSPEIDPEGEALDAPEFVIRAMDEMCETAKPHPSLGEDWPCAGVAVYELRRWRRTLAAQVARIAELEVEARYDEEVARRAVEKIKRLERLLESEREPRALEVRLDDDGGLDEIVGDGRFHLERMGGNDWHLTLGGLGMDLTGISGARPIDHENWRAARDAVVAPEEEKEHGET